ncbi:ATP-binding cassette domain-containing protein [Terriglobus albidus]|uniref:ATP-binding cassette domain-containing protein n=1 Tax=Terriglobus albidus TaxID=1592106 RepID=UPI0021E0F75B|nr:ATP-binding cassette domain-containing protein [Terriglobus albidus]
MAIAAVEFDALSLVLSGGRSILSGIHLAIEQGSTTALLGRSGSGKTTLLRMVNAMAAPTAGEARVMGEPVASQDCTSLRRGIGYVIQETGLFPHMTIERNVGLPLEMAGASKTQIATRVAELLPMVGLEGTSFARRYPWQLSGGQRQRVGLARALAADPPILLMDEPFGALDPVTRVEMQEMMASLIERLHKTVLLVTHDLEEALYLAQRVIFLEGGRVVADLPSNKVMPSSDPHVRQYIRAVRHNHRNHEETAS